MFQKSKKNLLVKIGLLFGVIILLAALGCKQQTPATETNQATEATPEISYPANEQANIANEQTNVVTNEQAEEIEGIESPAPSSSAAISPSASPSATLTPSPVASASPSATPTLTASPSPTPSVNDDDVLLKQQAEKLAEIYGTYTNKDKEAYKNLKDLKQYAATKFQAWLDLQMKKIIDPKAPFYGVTTKALSSAIIESSGNSKKVLVTVKKEEITVTSATPKVGYKMLILEFIKEKDEWKLDGIYWQ